MLNANEHVTEISSFTYQDQNAKAITQSGRKQALTYIAGESVNWGNPWERRIIWQDLLTLLMHTPFDQANLLPKFNLQIQLHMSEMEFPQISHCSIVFNSKIQE